jgi:hypothetical protein
LLPSGSVRNGVADLMYQYTPFFIVQSSPFCMLTLEGGRDAFGHGQRGQTLRGTARTGLWLWLCGL